MPATFAFNPVQWVTAEVDYNTAGIDTGILIGEIPNGAIIGEHYVYVQTAFNGGTNAMNIGISASGIEFANSTDIALTTAGTAASINRLFRGYAQSPLTSKRSIYVRYVQTGAAATTGKAHIYISWRLP